MKRVWGFEPVMLGNIKGFYDRYTNATKIAPEADKRNLDHKMCASYTDGSELSVEMASLMFYLRNLGETIYEFKYENCQIG